MLHFCYAPNASGFGIFLCTPVFFVKTKKGYLTILEASLRVESLRPDMQEGFPTSLPAGQAGGNDNTKGLYQLI